jgi:hypothetical protein
MNKDEYLVIKDNSVEEVFCKPFGSLECYPMSDELSEIMMLLSDRSDSIPKDFPEQKKPFLFKLIEKRMKMYTMSLKSIKLIMFLCVLTQTPDGCNVFDLFTILG